MLEAVAEADGDVCAVLEAEADEHVRDSGGTLAELGVGQGALAVDDGETVGRRADELTDTVGDVERGAARGE